MPQRKPALMIYSSPITPIVSKYTIAWLLDGDLGRDGASFPDLTPGTYKNPKEASSVRLPKLLVGENTAAQLNAIRRL